MKPVRGLNLIFTVAGSCIENIGGFMAVENDLADCFARNNLENEPARVVEFFQDVHRHCLESRAMVNGLVTPLRGGESIWEVDIVSMPEEVRAITFDAMARFKAYCANFGLAFMGSVAAIPGARPLNDINLVWIAYISDPKCIPGSFGINAGDRNG